AVLVDLPALAGDRAVEEVAGVELQPGLRGQNLERTAGLRLDHARAEPHRPPASVQDEVVVVALADGDLLVLRLDTGADGRRLSEVEGRARNRSQLPGGDEA